MLKVLYISAWYPTPKDKMMGLFVQKHADAVRAQGVDVKVLDYEQIPKSWRPDIIQLNVLSLKNALRTYWLHLRYRVPYVIVEHWSRYLPQRMAFPKGIERAILRFVAKRASCIMPVSNDLKQAMQACGIENNHWQIVNNVVDDFFYRSSLNPRSTVGQLSTDCRVKKVRLLHVSCFDEDAKNTKGLLRAYKQALASRPDLFLTMVGTGVDWQQSKDYATEIGLSDEHVRWTGELTPEDVSKEMQQADCFILFSNYENAPVVLSESLASGLPIISSRVGGIAEMIPNECGQLVASKDEKALENAIVNFQVQQYDPSVIRKQGKQYGEKTVGGRLVAIYQSVLS